MSFSFHLKGAAMFVAAGISLLGALAPGANAQANCSPGENPWTVGLLVDGVFRGNGVLISDRWVLTTAVIVGDLAASRFEVVAGDSDRCVPEVQEQFRAVAETYIPEGTRYPGEPKFMNFEHDIALLRLSCPIVPTMYVMPVALPADDSNLFPGEILKVAGWWRTSCSGPVACFMQCLDITAITHAEAASYMGSYLFNGHLPLFDSAGSMFIGNGSSGIGAYHYQNGGLPVLAGLMSFAFNGSGCPLSTYPYAFTRTGAYLDWIDWIQTHEGTPTPNPNVANLGGGGVPPCHPSCTQMNLSTYGGEPQLGNGALGVQLADAPNDGWARLYYSVGPAATPTPFPPTGTIYLNTTGSNPTLHWDGLVALSGNCDCSGAHAFPFGIPNNPSLLGVQVTVQAIYFCEPVPVLGIATAAPTNALRFTIF